MLVEEVGARAVSWKNCDRSPKPVTRMLLWPAVRTAGCRHGDKARGLRARLNPGSVTAWVSVAARSLRGLAMRGLPPPVLLALAPPLVKDHLGQRVAVARVHRAPPPRG